MEPFISAFGADGAAFAVPGLEEIKDDIRISSMGWIMGMGCACRRREIPGSQIFGRCGRGVMDRSVRAKLREN